MFSGFCCHSTPLRSMALFRMMGRPGRPLRSEADPQLRHCALDRACYQHQGSPTAMIEQHAENMAKTWQKTMRAAVFY